MAWILVPLQYLMCMWRAEKAIADALQAAGTAKHRGKIAAAAKKVEHVETLQMRFPNVTEWVDVKVRAKSQRNFVNS